MVSRGDSHDLGVVARHGTRIEEGRGPVGVAAVELALVGSVGIHAHEEARVGVGGVGVLPALVEDLAVVHDARRPVVLLIEAELADPRPIGAHAVEIGHVGVALHARHGDAAGRGSEEEIAVRQVAGIVVVHSLTHMGCHLPGARPVRADLEHLPLPLLVRHGEEHPVRVEMQAKIADKGVVLWPVQFREPRIGLAEGESHDGVVVAARRDRRVAVEIGRKPQICAAPPDEEDTIEVDRRM